MKKFNDIKTEQFKFSTGFQNAFRKVGLDIYDITEYEFIADYFMLTDEFPLKQFRVNLGKIYTQEMFDDEWDGYDDDDEKYKEDVEADKKRINKVEEIGSHLEFTVFLPKSLKFHKKNSEKYDLFVAAILTQASGYFKLLLKSVPDTFDSPGGEYTMAWDNAEGLGKFCTFHSVVVTNETIEEAKTVVYRLYKDGKFFYNLESEIGKEKYKWLMEEFTKVVQ